MSRKRVLSKHIKRFNIRYSANSIEYQFYKYFKHLKLDVEAQFPLVPYISMIFSFLSLIYYWSSMEVYMKSIGI